MLRPFANRPQSRDASVGQPAQVLHSPLIKYSGERWEDERPKLLRMASTTLPEIEEATSKRRPEANKGKEDVRLPSLSCGSNEIEQQGKQQGKLADGDVRSQALGLNLHTATRR